MNGWIQTRYLAAWIDVYDEVYQCQEILGGAVNNQSKVDEICSRLPFEDLNSVYIYYNAPLNPDIKAELLAITNLTAQEYSSLYDPSVENSIGYLIAFIDQKMASFYDCDS